MNYTEQLKALRASAIKDIHTYVEDCGETVLVRGNHRAMLRIEDDELFIGAAPAIEADDATLVTTADYLNSLP